MIEEWKFEKTEQGVYECKQNSLILKAIYIDKKGWSCQVNGETLDIKLFGQKWRAIKYLNDKYNILNSSTSIRIPKKKVKIDKTPGSLTSTEILSYIPKKNNMTKDEINTLGITYWYGKDNVILEHIFKYIIKNYKAYIIKQAKNYSTFEYSDANEVISNFSLRFRGNIDKFNPFLCKFTTWLHSCIHNETRAYFNTKNTYNSKHNSVPDYFEYTDTDVMIDTSNLDEIKEKDSAFDFEKNLLQRIIDTEINKEHKSLIIDYFTGKYSYKDLKTKYNISESNVKNWVYQAKQKIKNNKQIIEYNENI